MSSTTSISATPTELAEALLCDVRGMLADQINNRLTVLLALLDDEAPPEAHAFAAELARSISRVIQGLSLEELATWRARYAVMPAASDPTTLLLSQHTHADEPGLSESSAAMLGTHH